MKEELMRRTHLLNVLVAILLVTGLLAPSAATASSSTTVKLWIGKASMSVNGAEWPIDVQGTKPVIVEGRTLVPIRAVIEVLGGSAAWESSTRKATVTLGKDSLDLWIGKSQASLNGIALAIDSANSAVVPVITDGRTMLPLRFVAESLGIDVQYDATTKMITLSYTVGTTPPALLAPLLLGPAPNAVLSVLTPTLSWTAVPGATNYDVYIWVASDTHSAYLINEVVSVTSYTVPSAVLTTGVSYAWTVQAGNSVGRSDFMKAPGSTYTPVFMVQVTVLAAPHLVSPATEVILSTLTPTLSWTAVPGATKYEVHIWVASATPPPYVADEVLATTSYTIPSGVLTASVQYAWTVYAGNSLGWSASLTAPGSTYVPVFMVQAAFQAPSPGVIETQINGKFTGWDGDTIFELTNGQIWQQDSYAYTYHYAYRPKVLIYYVGGRYKMTVEGVDGFIYVTRLK
jgi:roadblock/LC7 domain-containing protein